MSKISNIEKEIIKNVENEFKNKIILPEYNKLILDLYYMFVYTGRADIMYCNAFLLEAIQLLKNSLMLYKDGFFDCAFYSIRQASEVIDNMIYVAQNPSKLKEWQTKGYFPTDSKIQNNLLQISDAYKEIKSLLSDFFDYHNELIKKVHKIVHKQGFDTFYNLRTPLNSKYSNFSQENETRFFIETLKNTIGKLFILLVVLDPMTLALTDIEINNKIAMNLMTEPININYFEKELELTGIIDKIKTSNYYKDFISFFKEREDLLPATYKVIRESYWDIDKLQEIKSQIHLLSLNEIFMFNILINNIRATKFYIINGLHWYSTSISSNIEDFSINTLEFQNYAKSKEKFNQKRKNVYISVVKNKSNDYIFIEHNEKFSSNEINSLLSLEHAHLNYIESFENL